MRVVLLMILLGWAFATQAYEFKDSNFHKNKPQVIDTDPVSSAVGIEVDRVNRIFSYNMDAYNKDIQELYTKTLSHIPFSDMSRRVAEASAYFLGEEYILGALGEGPYAEFNSHPLYRTDAFDYTTYVSTVLALAQSENLAQFKTNIKRVRYLNASVAFGNRNHFISADWNPNNQRNGYIKDITRTISNQYKTATALIDKPTWYKKLKAGNIVLFKPVTNLQALRLLSALSGHGRHMKVEKVSMDYIPLSAFIKAKGENSFEINHDILNKIPSGSIIEIVRNNWDLTKEIGTHLLVQHMGFAIRTQKKLVFREASSLRYKVLDVPFDDYFLDVYQRAKDKSEIGINVQEVLGSHYLNDIEPLPSPAF